VFGASWRHREDLLVRLKCGKRGWAAAGGRKAYRAGLQKKVAKGSHSTCGEPAEFLKPAAFGRTTARMR